MRIYVGDRKYPYGLKRFHSIKAQSNIDILNFSAVELDAIGAALDDANAAVEKTIASMDKLHITMQDCHRELRLARQIVEQSNQTARLAYSEVGEMPS